MRVNISLSAVSIEELQNTRAAFPPSSPALEGDTLSYRYSITQVRTTDRCTTATMQAPTDIYSQRSPALHVTLQVLNRSVVLLRDSHAPTSTLEPLDRHQLTFPLRARCLLGSSLSLLLSTSSSQMRVLNWFPLVLKVRK